MRFVSFTFPGTPLLLLFSILSASVLPSGAQPEPLHAQLDALVDRSLGGASPAAPCDDATFLRRVHLDFAGSIPSVSDLNAFLKDDSPDKRRATIERLLDAPAYATTMRDRFHVHLMERRGDDEVWLAWLENAFAENRPWDEMARSMLRADLRDEANIGASYFQAKRLEKYGANPTDYAALTRDVGRMFLGKDLQCAECHNHRTIRAYDQIDFQGLMAGFSRLKLLAGPPLRVEEQLMTEKLEYANVFTGKARTVGPKVPGLPEVELLLHTNAAARYAQAPDKKSKTPGVPAFSPLEAYARDIPKSPTFASNIVNRAWFLMMGRGLVEPLDQIHGANPASHPALLRMLSQAFAEGGYDLKNLFRELALTKVYQRASHMPPDTKPPGVDRFALALERRLSAEQLLANTLLALDLDPATVRLDSVKADKKADPDAEDFVGLRDRFLTAFAAEARTPELDFAPGLKSALFAMNDPAILALLRRDDALPARLAKDPDASPADIADALFRHLYSRPPNQQDVADVTAFLNATTLERPHAIADIAWAMMTATEFLVQH